jgi:hypothetical protein
MSAIEYSVIMSRTNIIEILLDNCKFTKEIYYQIFLMSIYCKKFLSFCKLLEIYDEKNIIDKFNYEEIYIVIIKILIIHQYDKFLKLMEFLDLRKNKDKNKDSFKFDFEKLENDVDILLISYLSLYIYKENSQKFKADKDNYEKEYSVLSRQFDEDGEKDFDEYEDEIREKIIMNANFDKSKIFNYEQAVSIVKKQRDNINININVDFNKNEDCNTDSNSSSYNGNLNKYILDFEDFIENKLFKFNEKINIILDEILEMEIINDIDDNNNDNDNNYIDNHSYNKNYHEIYKDKLLNFMDVNFLITHKYIKLLFKINKFNEMNILFSKLKKIFDKFSINCYDIENFIGSEEIEKNSGSENDYYIEEFNINSNENYNENKLKDNKTNKNNHINNINHKNPKKLIKKLIEEILSNKNSNIFLSKDLFNYSFSINKRKKNDNYFDKWQKPLHNFNNNNILSLCIKELKSENENNNYNNKDKNNNTFTFINLKEILSSKIFSIFLFKKIKNKRNILHLIFSLPILAKQILVELLNFIKINYNNTKFYQNLFRMLNEIDYKNLTPIDLTIKKKNYIMVEIYTKILNDFLMENYFSKDLSLISGLNKIELEHENSNENKSNTSSNFYDIDNSNNKTMIFSNFNFKKEEILYKVITIDIEVLNEIIEIPFDFKENFIKKNYLTLEESLKKINDTVNVYINLNLNLTFSDDNNSKQRQLINEEYKKSNNNSNINNDNECNLIECKKK